MQSPLIKPIFPIIYSERKENTLSLSTFVRKKHRGKWYLSHHVRNAYVPKEQNDYTAAISSFNRDIYLFQLFGTIDPKMKRSDGSVIYELDVDQTDEKERMNPLNNIRK